jgi:Mg-chelatase subunit ChlD
MCAFLRSRPPSSRVDPAVARRGNDVRLPASSRFGAVARRAAVRQRRLPCRSAVAVILCVDTSGSMRAGGRRSKPRSDAASAAVRAFIDAVPERHAGGNRSVRSSGGGRRRTRPAIDKDELRAADECRIPPPNGGTAIGDALATAARQLPPGGRRAIVLITDGVNNLPVADPAAGRAADSAPPGSRSTRSALGRTAAASLIPGTNEEAALDEDALRQIAADAHGAYARADDAGTLRSRLAALAHSTTREARRIDLALPLALAAGFILAGTVAAGMLAGRFP